MLGADLFWVSFLPHTGHRSSLGFLEERRHPWSVSWVWPVSSSFFGGLAIAVGLFASLVAFFTAGEMVVAYFMVHFPRGWLPIENDGELAALYFFAFLVIATKGSGRFSLDRALARQGAPEP